MLIVAQITILFCIFSSSKVILAFVLSQNLEFAFNSIFTNLIAFLILAFAIHFIVARPRLALDFAATTCLLNIILQSLLLSIPDVYTILMLFVGVVACAAGSESLTIYQEYFTLIPVQVRNDEVEMEDLDGA